jgi:hypothetical protein
MGKKILFAGILFLLLIFLSACTEGELTGETTKINVDIFKSPNCGCCVGHAAELKKNDFSVNTMPTNDMKAIKQKYNIPSDMGSCHTTIIEGYVVEGHVPMEAIEKLLIEKPEIDGIALPRMPSGTPGMPGPKKEPWIIYALKDGISSEFMVI